jgi:hypothetical protein
MAGASVPTSRWSAQWEGLPGRLGQERLVHSIAVDRPLGFSCTLTSTERNAAGQCRIDHSKHRMIYQFYRITSLGPYQYLALRESAHRATGGARCRGH